MSASTAQVLAAYEYLAKLRTELQDKILNGKYLSAELPITNQLLEYRVGTMSLEHCKRVERKLREILGEDAEDGDDGLEPMEPESEAGDVT